jgi:general secretion pathway protein E
MQTRVPLIDLRQVAVAPDAVRLIPEDVARRYNVLPLMIEGDSLRVAMDDPQNMDAINTLTTVTGYRIRPRLPSHGTVESLLGQYYRSTPQMVQQLESILKTPEEAEPQRQDRPQAAAAVAAAPAAAAPLIQDEVGRAPVVQAINMLITQAVKDRASDIHIEPTEENVRIRYRIDGVLHNAANLPKGVQAALISRVKVMAKMDIAERRRPQDGHFNLNVGGEEVDFRVASIETAHGEKVVLRILNKGTAVLSMSDLGFLPDTLQVYNKLLSSPFGMILVSGPTGSGKTTSLYASLMSLDSKSQNIMTIEDPIEYHFEGINQTQVNEQAGLTFAAGLRGILRLDPDIILVGEIRDHETATVAAQAALTGHLVLSSIHANDAASAITRLIDLGVEPFLVTSAVVGSVGQRLVRKLCSYCKTPSAVTPAEVAAYQNEVGEMVTQFYAGRGCNMCSRSGFAGRIGVFEVMPMSHPVRTMINAGAPASELRVEAIKNGMVTMRRDGMLKAKDGLTTPREVMRNVFTLL